jgi:hypothetical protein
MVFPHGDSGEKKAPEKPKEKPKLSDAEKGAAMKALPGKIHGCFLCKWILQDLTQNGNLTGHPKAEFAGATFPEEAKITHLRLEKIL